MERLVMHNKILLVDDEESILRSFTKSFESEGYNVTAAHNGEEGIIHLQKSMFNLVISDLIMPGVDGIAVIKEAREQNPNIGTIILTGYGDMKSAVDALRLGADDYILKPCDADELLIRSQRCIEKRYAFMVNKMYEKLLPICMYCKSIRDDSGAEPGKGKWNRIEEYISHNSGVNFSHACCPECAKNVFSEVVKQ